MKLVDKVSMGSVFWLLLLLVSARTTGGSSNGGSIPHCQPLVDHVNALNMEGVICLHLPKSGDATDENIWVSFERDPMNPSHKWRPREVRLGTPELSSLGDDESISEDGAGRQQAVDALYAQFVAQIESLKSSAPREVFPHSLENADISSDATNNEVIRFRTKLQQTGSFSCPTTIAVSTQMVNNTVPLDDETPEASQLHVVTLFSVECPAKKKEDSVTASTAIHIAGRNTTKGQQHVRRRQTTTSCRATASASNTKYTIPSHLWTKLQNVFYFAYIVRFDIELDHAYLEQNYEDFHMFQDPSDRAIVARKDNVCYVQMSSTWVGRNRDMWQNLNPLITRMPTPSGLLEGVNDTCWVRKGYYDAYFSEQYYDDFIQQVDACMAIQTDSEAAPELVVGGFSQGGPIAVVAGYDLARYDPIVIQLGGNRAIWGHGGCSSINSERYYRFNTVLNQAYDLSPSGFFQLSIPLQYRHVGHLFYIPEETELASINFDDPDGNQNPPLLYSGLDDNIRRYPVTTLSHIQDIYRTRMESIVREYTGCEGVPTGTWALGHWCNYDEECTSGECLIGVCSDPDAVKLSLGGKCRRDADCISNNCRIPPTEWSMFKNPSPVSLLYPNTHREGRCAF